MLGFQRDPAGRATLGGLALDEILAQAGVPTPAYCYDLDAIGAEVRSLVEAFGAAPHLVAYAVKANSAGSILRRVAAEGGGADVVSGAELALALEAGIAPAKIVMSGVAKLDEEIDRAITSSILAIQVESVEELMRVAARARTLATRARVALRINPAVKIDSHAHVATGHAEAKFGIVLDDLATAWASIDASSELAGVGVSTHVGSTLRSVEPYAAAARVVLDVARQRVAAGGQLRYLDFGGGFGIDYGRGACPAPSSFARAALSLVQAEGFAGTTVVVEPGRSVVGSHGVLLSSVIQTKAASGDSWVFLDAAMNDLLRPALYGSPHRVEPLERPPAGQQWRVAGPVCESADDFGAHRLGSPAPSRVVIRDAGAYGFTMASEYNGRPLPAEVFVSGAKVVHVSPSPGPAQWAARRQGA